MKTVYERTTPINLNPEPKPGEIILHLLIDELDNRVLEVLTPDQFAKRCDEINDEQIVDGKRCAWDERTATNLTRADIDAINKAIQR